jgi:type I restriction enzyme S subunit
MSSWIQTTLGAVAELYDGPHATPRKTDHGPWFLSISSLKNGRLDLSESAHISEKDFAIWTRRVTPQPGDVLFSYETRLGTAALMPDGLRACLGRRMALLRARRDVIDPRFLLYTYLGPAFQEEIRRRTTHGATVDRIPLAEMPSWPISLPPTLDEQHAIADVLSALDDKISVNERLARTALSLADAIFIKASEEHSDEIALHEIAEITMGSSPPGETYNEAGLGLPFYQGVRDFGLRHPKPRVWCSSPTRVAQPGDSLISVRAPVGNVNVASEVCCIGRGLATARSTTGQPITLYHALLAAKAAFIPYESEGTVFGAINKEQLRSIRIKWPKQSEADTLEMTLAALDSRADAAVKENDTLAQVRDTLLPKLMSGEIRVREAEKAVEEVL